MSGAVATAFVEVALSAIVVDAAAQIRAGGTDPAVVADYADAMEQGAAFPPVILFHDGGDHFAARDPGRVRSAMTRRAAPARIATAGFVAQIGLLVGGADEAALPRLDHFVAAIAWPVAFGLAGDEGFQQRRFPTATWPRVRRSRSATCRQVLANVLAAGNVGQVVGIPFAAEDGAGGRFLRPLRPFQHQHVVALAARPEDPRHHRRQEHRADPEM